MRVLLVTEDIPAPQVGGLGKHVITLGNALVRAGHQVKLLGRLDAGHPIDRAELGFEGDIVGGFDFRGTGWKEVRIGAWLPYKRLAMARRVERAILAHEDGADVVHYHGHLPMTGLGLAHVNFVQTRHDQGSECITHMRFVGGEPCTALAPAACAACRHAGAGALRKAVSSFAVQQYRDTARRSFEMHKTIFVSEFLRRQFVRAVPEADLSLTHVIHNFIDLPRFQLAAAKAGPIQPGRLFMAGRMDEAKGLGAFLEAFVPHLRSDQQVCVVGDGPEMDSLVRKFASPAVQFLGWQPHSEVLRLAGSSHVCVVPSVCEEAFGSTTLEALLLGRPTFALRRGATPELAVYERWRDQLSLADDISALARLAAQGLLMPAPALPVPESSGADVNRVLPALLNVYASRAPLDAPLKG